MMISFSLSSFGKSKETFALLKASIEHRTSLIQFLCLPKFHRICFLKFQRHIRCAEYNDFFPGGNLTVEPENFERKSGHLVLKTPLSDSTAPAPPPPPPPPHLPISRQMTKKPI